MRLFITGASGFIGTEVVERALDRGHEVVAMVRAGTDPARLRWHDRVGLTLARGDVRERGAWTTALVDCDAVLHLAYGPGDFHAQFATSVVGTEHLLAAMDAAGVRRLVHVSTFSVYDYESLRPGAVLDETSPLEPEPARRDDYAHTKLLQERLVRAAETAGDLDLTVLRPGAVYGPGKLWDAGLSGHLGGIGLAIAPGARLKLTEVGNCAEAIVLAAERRAAVGTTLNIVDDDLPTQRAYAAALRRHGIEVGPSVPIPYAPARAAAMLVRALNRSFFGGRARVPWLLVPAKLDARVKPLRYPNDRAKDVLGWRPQRSLDEALAAAVAPGTPG